MRFIGDVHGKYGPYSRLLKESPSPTIQVGDMGVGFLHLWKFDANTGKPKPERNPPYDEMVAGGHRFIRGNHDNPAACRRHTQCIADGAIENGMMFIGGGFSIDRVLRQEGYSWWADEELSAEAFVEIIDKYMMAKPHTMVTHDCPHSASAALMEQFGMRPLEKFPSRTAFALETMLRMHRPKLWVFGHWHVSFDQTIEGTRFVCLNELEMKDLDV